MNENENEKPTPADDATPTEQHADTTPTERLDDVAVTRQLDDVADTERLDITSPTVQPDDPTPTLHIDDTPQGEQNSGPASTPPNGTAWFRSTSQSHPDPGAPVDANRYATALEGVPRPRVRSGAIAWGLIVLAFSALMLTLTTVPGNAVAFAHWASSLTPGTITVIVVVAVGAFILLLALLSAIRRAQRRARSFPTAG
ncbi:hypothetical protein GCM10027568_32580 [Humibacter soli]